VTATEASIETEFYYRVIAAVGTGIKMTDIYAALAFTKLLLPILGSGFQLASLGRRFT